MWRPQASTTNRPPRPIAGYGEAGCDGHIAAQAMRGLKRGVQAAGENIHWAALGVVARIEG